MYAILFTHLADAVPGENLEGAVMFSIRMYIAENDETLNLVEGERVIVLGKKHYHISSGNAA